MTRIRLLSISLIVATAIAIVHIFGTIHFWYWKYDWLDLYMHFAGGLLIGLFAGGYAYGIWKSNILKYRLLFWTVLPVIFVGILWEWFEYLAGIPIEDNYVFDTTLDLIMDILGGIVAAVYLLVKTWPRLKSRWEKK